MINPTIHPKEPISNVAIPTMNMRANSGFIRCIIPTLYNTGKLSQ
jgi:hypothetical protein